MRWWEQFWPDLETEMARMDHEQAMVGKGDCQRCNQLADQINQLKLQAELDHVCFRQREELMQSQIDALIAEKRNNLCRCERGES